MQAQLISKYVSSGAADNICAVLMPVFVAGKGTLYKFATNAGRSAIDSTRSMLEAMKPLRFPDLGKQEKFMFLT